jgi:hypothetical protein
LLSNLAFLVERNDVVAIRQSFRCRKSQCMYREAEISMILT